MSQSQSDEYNEQVGELDLPLPKNHRELPRFCNMVRLFSKLASIQGKGSTKQTQDTVLGFINSWKKNIGDNIYPAVRLWYPQEDEKLRQLTRIKENAIGKMIANVLLLPPKSAAFTSLSNVKRGNFVHRANSSDEDGLAVRAKRAIDERVPLRDYSNLTIGDVLAKLGEFVDVTKESQMEIMKYFINTMNSDEFYWLIKIMQCNLNIRCSEKTFLRAFHPNAEQVYMVNKSLETVCLQLWSKDFSVSEKNKSVRPLSFFCPMLAKYIKGMSINFDSCVELMSSRMDPGGKLHSNNDVSFYIEEKIDGERVQIHWVRKRNITKFFSRRSLDHTDSYQSIFSGFDGNKGTKTMSDFLSDDVDDIILDGEVIAWDPRTNDFCGQSKVRELTHHVKPGQYKHMVFIFDIVYLNGEDLTAKPLSERKTLLESVLDKNKVNARNGRLEMLPFTQGHTANDIAEKFKTIVTEMSEGLVVKNPTSEYILNSRTNDWIKVKPEYIDGYGGETLDLVLVGAYRGSGKFHGNFGSYLVALRDETRHGRFVALSKVGSGICMAMHEYIGEKISPTRYSSPTPPDWLDLGNMVDSKPDAYIPYEQALVVEIKYSEIVSSDTLTKGRDNSISDYGVGYWLKFPRYVKLREDKTYETASCIGEFREIFAGRVHASYPPTHDMNVKRQNENTMSSLAKRVRGDQERKQKDVVDNLHLNSRILAGNTFYLCGDIEQPDYYSEDDLSKLIRENGGTVRETYDSNTYIIADRMVPKAAALVGGGKTILHPCWLFDSIAAGHLLTPEPIHYFSGVSENSGGLVDNFGFSLHRTQPIAEIKRLVDSMDFSNMEFSPADMDNSITMWKQFGGKDLRSLFFVGFLFYFDPHTISLDKAKLLGSLIHYAGGNVVGDTSLATHIICDTTKDSDVMSYNFDYGSKSVVSSDWVESSWFEKKIKSVQVKAEIKL